MSAPRNRPGRANTLRARAEKTVGAPAAESETLSPQELKKTVHELRVHQIELELQNEELRETQQALERSRGRFTDLFERAPVGYLVVDPQGRIVEANLTGADLLGVARKDLTGRSFSEIVAPEDQDAHYLAFKRLKQDGASQDLTLRLLSHGKARSFDTRWVQERDGEAGTRFRIAVLDATDRIKAEVNRVRIQTLERAAAVDRENAAGSDRIRRILDATSEGILVADPLEGRFTFSNAAMRAMLGYSAEELSVMGLDDIHPEEELSGAKSIFKKPSSDAVSAPFTLRRKDGTVFLAEVKAVSMTFGGVRCTAAFFQDLSRRRREEEERLTLQKLESLGAFAGGIAHDFNNMLAVLLGNLSLAKQATEPDTEIRQLIEESQNACMAARGLTRQLLTFAKGGTPHLEVRRLDPILKDAVSFAMRGSACACGLSLPSELWPAVVDKDQLTQAVQNLILNARQAMSEGGRITVSAENVVLPRPGAPALKPGRWVKVSVADTGPGIPENALLRIFDPYFSTKNSGRGLGLAACRSILLKHAGEILVESTSPKGTVFALYLPASDEMPPEEVPAEIRAGGGRILVMDDDPMVARILMRSLVKLGYSPTLVADGEAAVKAYESALNSSAPFDLVILDIIIQGGMGGLETLAKLKALDPKVKAVVSSGYSDDSSVAEHLSHGFAAALAKPYTIEALSGVLHDLMPR